VCGGGSEKRYAFFQSRGFRIKEISAVVVTFRFKKNLPLSRTRVIERVKGNALKGDALPARPSRPKMATSRGF
jgi:hypothetical protein